MSENNRKSIGYELKLGENYEEDAIETWFSDGFSDESLATIIGILQQQIKGITEDQITQFVENAFIADPRSPGNGFILRRVTVWESYDRTDVVVDGYGVVK